MVRSEIMHSIAYAKNSGTTNKSVPSTGDDSITLSMEWYWPNILQSEPEFPFSKNLWIYSRLGGHADPSNRDLDDMIDKGWNDYRLVDGARIHGESIPVKAIWQSKNCLDVKFDPVKWWISIPPDLQGKPTMSESNQRCNIPLKQSIELRHTYKINVDEKTNTNQYILVKLIFLEAAWLGDIYSNTGKHAYDISYQIDVEQFLGYT